MRIERSEMLSEGAGTPRLTAPSGMYLITWKRIKGINHHTPTPPKSGLEEDERGGTIICGGDAGLSGDAATETCKWGSLEHLWLSWAASPQIYRQRSFFSNFWLDLALCFFLRGPWAHSHPSVRSESGMFGKYDA